MMCWHGSTVISLLPAATVRKSIIRSVPMWCLTPMQSFPSTVPIKTLTRPPFPRMIWRACLQQTRTNSIRSPIQTRREKSPLSLKQRARKLLRLTPQPRNLPSRLMRPSESTPSHIMARLILQIRYSVCLMTRSYWQASMRKTSPFCWAMVFTRA